MPKHKNDSIKKPTLIGCFSCDFDLLIDKAKNQNIPTAANPTINHLTPSGILRTQVFKNVLIKLAIKLTLIITPLLNYISYTAKCQLLFLSITLGPVISFGFAMPITSKIVGAKQSSP